jgi:hypothetical protein
MGCIIYSVKDISEIAQEITGVSATLQTMEPERRDKVATYLEEIGSTLSNIAVALREDKPLDELNGALQMHTLMFASTVAGVIDADLIKKLQLVLGESSIGNHLRLMLDEPVPQPDEEEDFPESQLRKLNEAAGMFKALASSIKAKA